MSEFDSVITSLEAALRENPNDTGLLLHLAKIQMEIDAHESALKSFQTVLALEPMSPQALKGAMSVASEMGKSTLAGAYKQLLDSLGLFASDDLNTEDERSRSDEIDFEDQAHSSSEQEKQKVTHLNRVRGGGLRLVSDSDDVNSFFDLEDSNIYLRDVGGMEQVKKRLNLAFLAPLKNPELMKAYGKSVKGGLLLYGPPGCGKTFIARALAGELGAKFISIGITDILDMYIGESERKLHEIFETARRNAPLVLFIDELDAIGQKRSQIRGSGVRSLVNQLLAEMDSIGNENENVFILSATNHPWDVDSALRRPGRFDRVVAVFPPDAPARKAILEYNLKNKPAGDIDLAYLVEQTNNFSGADLAHLCDSSVEYVLEESLESGNVRKLVTKDFEKPLDEIRPSTLAWFETARNYAMFANESGAYDDLLEYIKKHKL